MTKVLKKSLPLISLITLLVLMVLFALSFRNSHFSFPSYVMKEVRIPEVIMLLVGATAAVISTYAIHLITKNRIADTGTIGISTLNLTMFTLVYMFADGSLFITLRDSVMPLVYFGASLLVLLAIYWLTIKFKDASEKIILLGIVFALIISAINYALFANMSDAKSDIISDYRIGMLNNAHGILTQTSSLISYAFLSVGLVLLLFFRKSIRMFYVDPVKAKSLGVNIKLIRVILFTVSALGAAVLFTTLGEIGFIGFMATNIVYLFVNKVGAKQFVYSWLIGLISILVMFMIKHTILPATTPVGVLSSIIAVPYLIFILVKGNKNG